MRLKLGTLLQSLPQNQQTTEFNATQALRSLNNQLEKKQIKVLLSPLRYQVDILRSNIKEVKHELLTKIAQPDWAYYLGFSDEC